MKKLIIVCLWMFPAMFAPSQPSPSIASVDGSVVNKLTGGPIKNAYVIYTRIGPGTSGDSSPISVETDVSGHFILQLAPGTYRLWVERNGFARQMYGALSPAGEGTALTLAPGQQVGPLLFRVVPLGAVAGRVVDEDGEPVQSVGIQLLRFSYANGRRQLISVGGASTNDRGEYRVFGIRAGRYLLRASMPGAPLSRPLEAGALVPEAQDPYASVYYPGVLDVDSATPVSLVEGSELADVDFHLPRVRAATVRGRLVSPAERLSSSQIQVVLAHNEGNAASSIDRASASIDFATGKFEIRGVSPGSYLLVSSQLASGRLLGGRVPVEVSPNVPPENIVLSLVPSFEIVGTVEVEGAPRGSVPNLTIRLTPSEGLALGPQPTAKVGSDGGFRLAGITPGLWTLAIDSLAEGFWIKSESLAENEILTGEVNVNESTRGQIRIVLANNGGQISGTVTADRQPCRATVVLVPAPAELRGAHQIYRITNSIEHGTFNLKGIRPGTYKLFAFQEAEPFAWFDPEQLRMVEEMGETITIGVGESQMHDLVAIPPESLLPTR